MIIGLVGTICSGKSEASEYLQEHHGLVRLATGDEVLHEAKKRSLLTDRSSLQALGKRLEDESPGYWSHKLLDKINTQNHYIVEGLRYPGQIEPFFHCPGFRLFGLNADTSIRRERYISRAREGDVDFKLADKNDRSELQQTDACLEMALEVYMNNHEELDPLYAWIDEKMYTNG